jgi:preprotein translocase subunit SecA
MSLLEKIFGSANERYLKSIQPMVDEINGYEESIHALSDEELTAKTDEFKKRLADGETLDDILTEAYAVVREAAWRTLGQRHYDVQMIGAIALHQGKITEMKTGEGKTLSSTCPIYLNALAGRGVHVVTVNDYLAERDANWMSPIYKILGLTVGSILNRMDNEERQENYRRDITYGTNNEFGFDYLRDNMIHDKAYKVQRDFFYCIVDEIDSVLIDEARTPLIISGTADNDIKFIRNARKLVSYFQECEKNEDGRYPDEADPFNPQKPVGDFKIDEKSKSISFTDDGMNKAESLLSKMNLIKGSLYDQENFEYVHYITQALKAHHLFSNEVDYLVKDNEVQIVDEHTGRVLSGRRYSDGLHQAIEAKEGITIQRRSKTYASITFQNFFRMYEKLGGMTGTADTEAAEFKNIYGLDVVVIPTNRPIARIDYPDRVYITFKDKSAAILEDIKEIHNTGQPILVGTVSVEKSEYYSNLLKRNNIRHNVLNAKNHAGEAGVIASAGKVGAVTIATNMAGRGTDIKLGGDRKYDEDFEDFFIEEEVSAEERELLLEMKELMDRMKIEEAESYLEKLSGKSRKFAEGVINSGYDWIEEHKEVKELGGLFIVGTERHESRRIDNQLRGRSGRQGDNGASRFYISLEDDLMRLFGGERIQRMMQGFGVPEGELIEHPWITGSIEKAQKRVESRNFEIRKYLLEYDDVLNKQRGYIYDRRDDILSDDDIIERVKTTALESLSFLMDDYRTNMKGSAKDAVVELVNGIKEIFFMDVSDRVIEYQNQPQELQEELEHLLTVELTGKEKVIGKEYLNGLLRELYIRLIDRYWQGHLENMDQLRESVRLRAYSQKNPLIEYKLEGSTMFDELVYKIRENVLSQIFKIKIETVSVADESQSLQYQKSDYSSFGGNQAAMQKENAKSVKMYKDRIKVSQTVTNTTKVGRNDPCPCGSGKKYKHCCGR